MTRLTKRVRRIINVQQVVRDPAGEVATSQSIQRPIVQSGHVPRDNRGSEETDVLKAILLSALGTHDTFFGG